MYEKEIIDKVYGILKGSNFTQEDYKIHIGYAYVKIEFNRRFDIYSDGIRELEEYFNASSTVIYLNDENNLVLMYDITKFKLEKIKSW